MNKDVTTLLDSLNHPLREEIDQLRLLILSVRNDIEENIKWNGPNYTVGGDDRISIKVQPKKDFHLILHRGSKVLPEPDQKLLQGRYDCLIWKSNDRAVASFKDKLSFEKAKAELSGLVEEWLSKTV